MDVKKRIGFIGLGNMGLPMSKNLIKSGFEVYGYDINSKSVGNFKQAGGNVCLKMDEVTQHAELLFVSLPSPAIVKQVFFDDGLIKNAKKDLMIIDTSTVAPELNIEVYETCEKYEIKYLGAPVSGGVIGAVNSTLTFMVGGKKEYLDEVKLVLEILGKNIFHVGESADSGTVIKLINNLMIGFYTQAVAEALTIGETMGLHPDQMYEILSVSYGQSKIYERNYREYISENNFEPGFTTNLLLKDLKLAKEMAQKSNINLPIGSHLIEWYNTAVNEGFGESDMASVYLMMKKVANVNQKVTN